MPAFVQQPRTLLVCLGIQSIYAMDATPPLHMRGKVKNLIIGIGKTLHGCHHE